MSTAALMHDRWSLPMDAEPLSVGGYFCVVEVSLNWSKYATWNRDEVSFKLVCGNNPHRDQNIARITIPHGIGQVSLGWSGQYEFAHEDARAASEVMYLASEFAQFLDESLIEERENIIRRQEEDRAKRELEYELRRKRQAEENEKRKTLYAERKEMLGWHIESQFRLKRKNKYGEPMKAVVFGTIKDFIDMPDGRVFMTTVSEKGKSMRIDLMSITQMDIKEHEVDKRYKVKVIVPENSDAVA